jgi:hypothetical protein
MILVTSRALCDGGTFSEPSPENLVTHLIATSLSKKGDPHLKLPTYYQRAPPLKFAK